LSKERNNGQLGPNKSKKKEFLEKEYTLSQMIDACQVDEEINNFPVKCNTNLKRERTYDQFDYAKLQSSKVR